MPASPRSFQPNENLALLNDWYSQYPPEHAPNSEQWQNVLSRSPEAPLVLINFFKFRERAHYPPGHEAEKEGLAGSEAFQRYASISIPSMQSAGGEFLLVGSCDPMFIGTEENWDLIAIGRYPNVDAFISLYSNEEYREAFAHRVAACAEQKVLLSSPSL